MSKPPDKTPAPPWTYRRTERWKGSPSNYITIITHTILYKGKVQERTTGPDESEGKRVQAIVEQCNKDGVIPDKTVVGADLPSAATRSAALNRIEAEKKEQAVKKWAKAHGVAIYEVEGGWRCLHHESGKAHVARTKIGAASGLTKKLRNAKPWEDYYE